MEACYSDELPRRVEPTEADLASPLHHLLQTRFGRLDLLGTVVRGLEYADLLPRTWELPFDGGQLIRVLDLPGLIELKERAQDQAHLPLLRAALEEQIKRAGESGNTGGR